MGIFVGIVSTIVIVTVPIVLVVLTVSMTKQDY